MQTHSAMQDKTFQDLKSGIKWDINEFEIPRLPFIVNLVVNCDFLDNPVTINDSKFKRVLNPNFEILETKDSDTYFLESGIYIEDMPIKFPGTNFRIPVTIWNLFGGVLEEIIAFEILNNLNYMNSYIYLTIHQSYVKKDTIQRTPGWHIDGFQKDSIIPQIIQHQYALTNTIPTRFAIGEFETKKLFLPKKEFFRELVRQAREKEVYEPNPYSLHLLNSYCVHEPGISSLNQFRTFLRFSVSDIPFMRNGNTKNLLFQYDWSKEKKSRFYDSISK